MILCRKESRVTAHQPGNERKKTEELARLDIIVENSSEKNRNFFIAYLGLLIYVQAIIFSTTDLQLLVSTDGLKLPLIDLNVPLVGFYVVVPIFIIALHFNFLQNLESHHYKLMQWQAAHMGGKVPRKFIYPFLFDYAILEQGSQFQRLVKIANSILCYNLAPITLGVLLIRFSDRQDFSSTLWHYLAFVFDSYLVWKLRISLRQNEQPNNISDKVICWPYKGWYFIKDSFKYGMHGLFGLLILLETVLSGLIGATSDKFFVRHVQPWIEPNIERHILVNKGDLFETTNFWQGPLKLMAQRPIEWLLPYIKIKPSEVVWKPDTKELEAKAKLSGQQDWVKHFNEKEMGFKPEFLNLRFLQLSTQNLSRAIFSQAKLQGAELERTNMQGAILAGASLQGANMSETLLQGADLSGSKLQAAKLFRAELQGANLSYASLQAAALDQAQMQGTDLTKTNMQGTSLPGAKMQGAYLNGTEMQAAFMNFADMQGAHLRDAHLQGASLVNTNMDGIILEDTDPEQKISASDHSRPGFFIISIAGIYSDPWDEIEKYGDSIGVKFLREQHKTRIREAEKGKHTNKTLGQLTYHAPQEIAHATIGGLCSIDSYKHIFYEKNDGISAIRYFRLSYQKLKQSIEEPSTEREYKKLLIDIDSKICTLPECANIRDVIEGLDCKFFLEESAKKPKQPHRKS
jgi:uncharacterized protein YjbI with pentapeptide repeats